MKVMFLGLALAALTFGAASADDSIGAQTTTSANSSTAPALRVGTLIKDDKGQALGRVSKVIPATATTPARVDIRIGDEVHSVVQSLLTAKDTYFIYSPKGDVKASLPFSNE